MKGYSLFLHYYNNALYILPISKKKHLKKEENNIDKYNSIPSQNTSILEETTKNSSNRIMLVDDDTDILLTIKKILEYDGFQVETFSNPLEALSSFKSELYDLVLIDIKMPEMSGFEFYRELQKKIDYGSKIKICFITAFEIYFETLKNEFPELYSGCFINKPVKAEDLLNKIKEELTGN